MPHPKTNNCTPWLLEAVHLMDPESGGPVCVLLMQSTFAIEGNLLRWMEPQPPIEIGGRWRGDPTDSSLVLEPQVAIRKPGTDVVLLGHACAPHVAATEVDVGLRLGPLRQLARVFGERRLIPAFGGAKVSRPEPFERIPLTYERAFGGWDRRHPDAGRHTCERRNPVGVGYHDVALALTQDCSVPNIENPARLYKGFGDHPTPVGFGFVGPHWMPRASHAGTFDAAWEATRKPLLPKDFDARFFNAAAPGLTAPSHLRGDEPVAVVGTSAAALSFHLPGLPPPVAHVELRKRNRAVCEAELDTVVVDTDQQQVTLLWRSHLLLPEGPHDIVSIEIEPVTSSWVPGQRPRS